MKKEIVLIVGLGNPGDEYARTRHNAGFDTVDRLAARLGVSLRRKLLLEGAVAELVLPEAGMPETTRAGAAPAAARKLVLCEPQTFMNASGRCVRKLMNWYQVPPEQMLVIYDDIDLPPAKLRFRKNGGPGTHNGMRSIVEETGTDAFPRIRVGTGDRPEGADLVSWVLGRFSPEDRKRMEQAFEAAADLALIWAREGAEKASQAVASLQVGPRDAASSSPL